MEDAVEHKIAFLHKVVIILHKLFYCRTLIGIYICSTLLVHNHPLL